MRRLIVLVLITICACFASTSPVQAAFPGENGRIAFTAQTYEGTPHLGVWSARPNGKHRELISKRDNKNASNPAWSPSGDRIAYTIDALHKRVIVAAPDGTHDRVVFERLSRRGGYFGVGNMTWSPSGLRLLFMTPKGLFVVRRDGTHLHGIGLPHDTEPAWSPNGRWIAVIREQSQTSFIVVMHPDGSARHRVARGDSLFFPDWSPDGTSLVFQKLKRGQLDLFAAPLAGSLTRITHTPAYNESAPTWSPDGRWILYSRWRERASGFPFGDLWKKKLTTGRAIRITQTPNVDEWMTDWRAV